MKTFGKLESLKSMQPCCVWPASKIWPPCNQHQKTVLQACNPGTQLCCSTSLARSTIPSSWFMKKIHKAVITAKNAAAVSQGKHSRASGTHLVWQGNWVTRFLNRFHNGSCCSQSHTTPTSSSACPAQASNYKRKRKTQHYAECTHLWLCASAATSSLDGLLGAILSC
jgi:hypothetical protein